MDQHSKQDHIAEDTFSESLERFLTSLLHRRMLLALCTVLVASASTWAYGFQNSPVMISPLKRSIRPLVCGVGWMRRCSMVLAEQT